MILFFFPFGWFFVCIKFRICGPIVSAKCARDFHAKKHVKLYIKTYVFIFCISSFLPRYLCRITYACEKSSLSNICHLNLFHLDFIVGK
jgi:hypothetical protein